MGACSCHKRPHPYVYRLINTLTLPDYYSATYLLLRKKLNANTLGLQNYF